MREIVTLAALALPLSVFAQTPGNPAVGKEIAVLLSGKCLQCHSQTSRMGDLDLGSREGLLKGGKNGPAIVAGKAAESRLYRHLTGQLQPRMPFGGSLNEQEIALFKSWIDAGAEWNASALTSAAPAKPKFSDAQKRYWAFQPVTAPAGASVDSFILARLKEKGIRPNEPADRVTLLRRATLDLIGLPPTPEETQAFLADTSPGAFAKVVDRLLASPHYGERWGRQWLDVARYADTNGFKADEIRPNIWRYRDYVIQAFNDDKPYDRFIREQLAGDELYPGNVDARIATGFLRHYTDETNQPSMETRREELLMNITDTVGSAFMGMTFGCAKCHDHKFDPILHKDYYRLQAFFANVRAKDDFIPLSGAELEAVNRQQAEWEAKTKDLRAAMHALVAPFAKADADVYMNRFSEGTREAINTPPEKRTSYQALLAFQGLPQVTYQDATLARKLPPEQKKQFDLMAAQVKEFDSLKPHPPLAQTMIDNSADAPETYVLAGGAWNAPKEEVQPGFLSILDPADAKFTPPPGLSSTGRRTALANWLADPKNPLTARVMVNRIWQGHFGTGIVASSSDFGVMGERPANQALLDSLAASFVRNGWSIKKLHRAIMLSNVYQESSATQPEAAAADPDNKLLWHYPRHRVEGEVLRDAMLMTSGRLNLKMGGPGVHPELPEGVNTAGYAVWAPEKDEAEARRRSVYVFVKRILTYPMLEAFDAPTSEESCPRRFSTVVPSQALTLMNDKYVLDWSREFAGRVLNDGGLSRSSRSTAPTASLTTGRLAAKNSAPSPSS
ncbi:MAG: PSD1 and planctomycete cytochrome C domain-containing protein [Acidobacteriota bacterium]